MVAPLSDRPVARVIPPQPVAAAATMLLFTAVLYLSEAIDQFTPLDLDDDGIRPWSLDGLDGILWSPLLHGGWGHLFTNTLPFLVFGFLAMAGGIRQWLLVTAMIWIIGGAGVWLTGGSSINSHIGASGVIFGWLAFLLARGFFARSGRQIALAAVLLFLWGGLLWGVLPGQADISWQAHLFGALAGILAARVVARPARRAPRSLPGAS
ncbi:rhomboid family intramembrane serine protease [Pseudonocardia humida]|uniref:Rhomboid family intramembrane serine protease n=1 Tax=Pseudonocardia humida TaxID=2800819 RepID=A0ABT0ZTC7_9PSEU|nr:rhomboid family intramembrane serine protease [Pseudonocardia humida]MCO1653945.1 rhomboid family intramembrane serine protease [Pseudonocardia humida]